MSLATRVLNGRRALSALPKLLGSSSTTAARAPRCTSACITATHSPSTQDVITVSGVGGHIGGAPADRALAGQRGRRGPEVRQPLRKREDQQRMADPIGASKAE